MIMETHKKVGQEKRNWEYRVGRGADCTVEKVKFEQGLEGVRQGAHLG